MTPDGACHRIQGISRPAGEEIPPLVRTVHRQVLGNFRLSGTVLFKYLGGESRVVVPEGVTVIAEEAFAGNESIDRVLLPESVTEIGAGAFRDCTRVAALDPAMWTQLFTLNAPALCRAVGALEERLGQYRRVIEAGDREALLSMLAQASGRKKQIDLERARGDDVRPSF